MNIYIYIVFIHLIFFSLGGGAVFHSSIEPGVLEFWYFFFGVAVVHEVQGSDLLEFVEH